jgi:hypothetical protein
LIYYNCGYDSGTRELRLINNLHARNPTLEAVLEFLKRDKTDLMLYVDDNFVCADFTAKIHNNAERQGLRCGYARVCCYDGSTHACNVWNTTDAGLIYTDSTGLEYFEQNYNIDCNDSIAIIRRDQDYECYSIVDDRMFKFDKIVKIEKVIAFW